MVIKASPIVACHKHQETAQTPKKEKRESGASSQFQIRTVSRARWGKVELCVCVCGCFHCEEPSNGCQGITSCFSAAFVWKLPFNLLLDMPPNKNVSVHMQINGEKKKERNKESLLTWSLGNTLSGFYQNFALQGVSFQRWIVAVLASIKKSFVSLQRNGRSLDGSPKSKDWHNHHACLSGSRYSARRRWITQRKRTISHLSLPSFSQWL